MRLRTLIDEARVLSPPEQLELIGAISHFLRHSYQQTLFPADFWKPKTVEQLAQAQRVQPIADLADLVAGFWPSQESTDDFIEYIYQQRREDCLRD